MKHTRIIFFYIVTALAAVYARTAQILYLTEEGSGFFTPDGRPAAIVLTIFIVLAVAAACFVSFLSKRTPKKPPEESVAVTVAHIVLAVACLFEALVVRYTTGAVIFVMVTRVLALLSALCLLIKAFGRFLKLGASAIKLTLVLPVAFLLMKTVSVFTVYASVSVIATNVFYLAFLAGAVIYMLLLAKFENGIMPRRSSYALFPAMIFTTIAAACCVLPYIAVLFSGRTALLHDSPENFVLCLAVAVFVNIYTFATYHRSNLLRRRVKTRRLQVEDTYTRLGNQFLIGEEVSDSLQKNADEPTEEQPPLPDPTLTADDDLPDNI